MPKIEPESDRRRGSSSASDLVKRDGTLLSVTGANLPGEEDLSSNERLKRTMEHIVDLKVFLVTAPAQFTPNDIIRRFHLPNDEEVSCVRWNNIFYITGTDIVRCLTYRFAAFGRVVTNKKKFEEGVFSDLRNLKCNVDATLEKPKSDFLEFLYKHHCVRTKKKQKVFFWYSVRHERLFVDALERDLKREAIPEMPEASTTTAVAEPSLSFRFDPQMSLYDQLGTIMGEMPTPLAAVIDATLSSHVVPVGVSEATGHLSHVQYAQPNGKIMRPNQLRFHETQNPLYHHVQADVQEQVKAQLDVQLQGVAAVRGPPLPIPGMPTHPHHPEPPYLAGSPPQGSGMAGAGRVPSQANGYAVPGGYPGYPPVAGAGMGGLSSGGPGGPGGPPSIAGATDAGGGKLPFRNNAPPAMNLQNMSSINYAGGPQGLTPQGGASADYMYMLEADGRYADSQRWGPAPNSVVSETFGYGPGGAYDYGRGSAPNGRYAQVPSATSSRFAGGAGEVGHEVGDPSADFPLIMLHKEDIRAGNTPTSAFFPGHGPGGGYDDYYDYGPGGPGSSGYAGGRGGYDGFSPSGATFPGGPYGGPPGGQWSGSGGPYLQVPPQGSYGGSYGPQHGYMGGGGGGGPQGYGPAPHGGPGQGPPGYGPGPGHEWQ